MRIHIGGYLEYNSFLSMFSANKTVRRQTRNWKSGSQTEKSGLKVARGNPQLIFAQTNTGHPRLDQSRERWLILISDCS